jgi:hypothetical protein
MSATKTKTIVRPKRKGGLTKTRLATWFTQWVGADREAKAATARKNELRDSMLEALEREGYTDDKGHAYLDLPEEVGGYTKIQRQRRVSQSLDNEGLEGFLKERELWMAATEVRREISEEKLARLVFEGKISEEDFKSFLVVKETFAFVPVR